MGENPAVRAPLGQRRAAKSSSPDAFDAVVIGEPFVEKGVIGVHYVAGRLILRHQIGEEQMRLGHHRVDKPVVARVLGEQLPIGIGKTDLIKVQPVLEKAMEESVDAARTKKPVDLSPQDLAGSPVVRFRPAL